MNGTLSRLVYVSRNPVCDDADHVGRVLEQLVASCCGRGSPDGVGGLLMYNASCVAGILDGERPHVRDAFDWLRRDERHARAMLLTLEPLCVRSYDGWSTVCVANGAEWLADFVAERESRLVGACAEELVELPCGRMQREHLLELVDYLAGVVGHDAMRHAA